jgi:hypothetical protein
MPIPAVISDLSPIIGTGPAPNGGQPGGGENPSTFDDYLRAYGAFIAQLRAGSGFANSGAFRIPFFDASGNWSSSADFVRDASGNVGIGTAAPGARLEISTNASNPLRITKPVPSQAPSYIQDPADLSNLTLQAGSTAGFFSAVEVMGWNGTGNQPRVTVWTAGSERMRIDASGNVGIGATSFGVGERLRVANSTATFTWARVGNSLNDIYVGVRDTGEAQIASTSAQPLMLWTNNAERMRIDSTGHQINLPGSTTPPTLTVNGQLNITPTSNTNVRISFRGTDGVTRVANITLA